MLFFSRLSKREKFIAIISVVLIAGVFLDKIVFAPVINKFESLNEQILIQEKKLKKTMRILLQEELITDEYEKYVRHIKQERSNEEEVAVLLKDIEEIANDSSVFIVDMKPSPVKNWESYKKYTIKIEAEATVGYLADFIYRLEKTPRLLRVVELRLSPKKNEFSILRIRMAITQILVI